MDKVQKIILGDSHMLFSEYEQVTGLELIKKVINNTNAVIDTVNNGMEDVINENISKFVLNAQYSAETETLTILLKKEG